MNNMAQRKMIVLTGGPCSGKTKLIEEIERRGFNTLKESARAVIREGKFGIDEREKMQLEIFSMQIKNEETLRDGLYFLDRSAVDSKAYSRFFLGNSLDIIESFPLAGRYQIVMFLEQLPFEKDGERIEKDELEALNLHSAIERAYLELNYNLIHVPVFSGSLEESVMRRTNYVLRILEEKYGMH